MFIPQDIDYPSLQLDIDRERASELGLNQREVVDNVITALTSNSMIAPSFWIDPKSGNDYMLTVQYPESQMKTHAGSAAIPLRVAELQRNPTRLDAVSKITRFESPTEVDHYQLRRITDIYVQPTSEDLGSVANAIDAIDREDQRSRRADGDTARHGAGHARVVQELRARLCSGGGAAVSDSGGAVPVVPGSVPDSAGGADRD